MKTAAIASLALAATAACTPKPGHSYPTTTLHGVEVVDTQLVRDARAVIENFTPYLHKHSLRTWLLGAAAINANQTLKASLDMELHAVTTILHDLGWDMTPGSPWISADKRFEVDGGLGALKFVKGHPDGKKWDAVRLEKMYDGIALHGSPGLQYGKNLDVQWILTSIGFDNPGARNPLIPEAQYNSVVAALPNADIVAGTNETWVWLAATKPVATYNTIVEPFGTAFVPGYSAIGHRVFDLINGSG
ncbi:putative cyanamide hydratase [Rosellinia necatrix]|uniref:Putative cyanamide hydratase n=1 Tax=Rosellinia necatrix TaxID=77044 RepID=A0A1W2TC56_ROSNE|nr:putative cyanamide hydratase [Rosellinia necatrix]